MTLLAKPAAKVNYLNNRDILKEIHLSKNTYCSYRDPVNDHQYDIILPSLTRINQRTIAEARRNRADRIKRETGEVVDPKKIANTDIVFRITTWEHIPMAPKKVTKAQAKKRRLEDILDLDDATEDAPEDELLDIPVLDPTHMRVNFPPFFHYRINEHKVPYIVGKSHWRGDLDTGEFSKDHGTMTRKLAMMFMKWSGRETFLKENPHIQPILTAPAIVSSVAGMGSHRVPDGFKEVLSKVAEKHPGSAVGEKYGRKSIKEARSAQVVKKHVDRITKRLQSKK